jgi:hypothetical protein
MPKKRSNKDRFNFLIDRGVYDDFSMICEEMGFVRSKMVEKAMQKMIDDYKHILSRLKGR